VWAESLRLDERDHLSRPQLNWVSPTTTSSRGRGSNVRSTVGRGSVILSSARSFIRRHSSMLSACRAVRLTDIRRSGQAGNPGRLSGRDGSGKTTCLGVGAAGPVHRVTQPRPGRPFDHRHRRRSHHHQSPSDHARCVHRPKGRRASSHRETVESHCSATRAKESDQAMVRPLTAAARARHPVGAGSAPTDSASLVENRRARPQLPRRSHGAPQPLALSTAPMSSASEAKVRVC
jgi:hypothetical protein